MPLNLSDQLINDLGELRHYDSLGLDLPADLLIPLAPRLVQPSLVVLGYGRGVSPQRLTVMVQRLAQLGLRYGRRVRVVSGRDWTTQLRASCLVGERTSWRLATERPRPDDPELDARKYLGDLACIEGRFSVYGVDQLSEGVTGRDRGVDLCLVDDVAGVEAILGKTDDLAGLDPSPQGMRQMSRLAMCTAVVTVDWRLTERWRWEREADAVVDVVADDEGRPVIRDGEQVERVPLLT